MVFSIKAAPILSPASSPNKFSCKISVSMLLFFNKILANIIPPSPLKLFIRKEPSLTPKFKYFKNFEFVISFCIIFKPSVDIWFEAKFKYINCFDVINGFKL